jgi:hypothetical protein
MSAAEQHPVEALSALLDGEVAEGERVSIEAHLTGCGVCRDLLEDMRLLDCAVVAEAPPPVPVDLASRIREKLDAPASSGAAAPSPWRRARRRRRDLRLAAAACILVGGLVWILRPGPTIGAKDQGTPPPASPVAAPEKQDRIAVEPSEARTQVSAPPASGPRASGTGSPLEPKRITPKPSRLEERERADEPTAKALRSLVDVADTAVAPAAGGASGQGGEPAFLEASPYRVRLLPDGRMSVETSGYACMVPLSREDALNLAAIARAAQVRQEGAVQEAAQPAPSDPGAAGGSPWAAVVAPRICPQLPPEDCRFVMALVHDRYRAPLEQRCGPPPR